jgi:hypothetical protein
LLLFSFDKFSQFSLLFARFLPQKPTNQVTESILTCGGLSASLLQSAAFLELPRLAAVLPAVVVHIGYVGQMR